MLLGDKPILYECPNSYMESFHLERGEFLSVAVGQRASILLMMRSAALMALAMADSKTGEGRPSQWARLRAARMEAAISNTRLRPSSTARV